MRLLISASTDLTLTWMPEAGDKYVLCQGTKFWDGGSNTPAIVTVEEVLADDEFRQLNVDLIQQEIEDARVSIQSNMSSLSFIKVPCLFFGDFNASSLIIPDFSCVAFNPGPTNLQPLNSALYVPRQFGPRNTLGVDIFEDLITIALGGTVCFIDCWEYHKGSGEIHCGSAVKRSTAGLNWWENIP